MEELIELLNNVEDTYEDFVIGVIAYIKIEGNEKKIGMIKNFIIEHPEALSSDILEFITEKTGFFESVNRHNRLKKESAMM